MPNRLTQRIQRVLFRICCQPFQKRNLTRHDFGEDNALDWRGSVGAGSRVQFQGSRNSVQVEPDTVLIDTEIKVLGSEGGIKIGERVSLHNVRLWMHGDRCQIIIENDVFMNDSELIVTDNDARIRIGEQSMIGSGCEVRCGDGHALYDRKTHEILNRATFITLERRVWLGTHVQVLKDVVVGEGAVVGSCSVVTKDIPPHTLAVGIPARPVRENVGWTRESIDRLPKDWSSSIPAISDAAQSTK